MRHPLRVFRLPGKDNGSIAGSFKVLVAKGSFIDQIRVQQAPVQRTRTGRKRFQQDFSLSNLLGRRTPTVDNLFKPKFEQRNADGKLLLHSGFGNMGGLLFKNTVNLNRLGRFEHLVANPCDPLRLNISRDAQNHVMQVVKSMIALIKQFRSNLRNTLNRTSDVDPNRMFQVKRIQKVKKDSPLGIVFIHLDFLPDDPLFFLNGLLRKIRGLDKIEQDFQGFINVFRAGK